MRILLFLFLWLAVTSAASAQWGPGGCAPAGPVGPTLPTWTLPQLPPSEPVYRWQLKPDGWYQLWRDGIQLGCWKADAGYVPLWVDGSWGPAGPPPVAPPQAPEPPASSIEQNFGVDLDKLGHDECKYKINGKPACRDEVVKALKNGHLDDDSKKPRLVIIGPGALRHQVLSDLKSSAELKSLTGNFVIQDYPPDHWHVAQAGFVTTGQPSIYLQLPQSDGKGKVLHHQDDYQGGAPALATAIRRADATYNPRNDPDLRTVLFDFCRVPVWAWIVVAIAITAILVRKKP
jgi:hypothetical protein